MQSKILLVDDREDNLVSIESILRADEYRLVKASSGTEALKILLQEYDFALILMDVKMPNLNGFETASLIYEREKLRHIPIVFITAYSYDEENVFKGYQTGAVDYIYKPIKPDLLRAKVSVFVDLYKKTRQLIAQEQRLITINKSLEAEISERKISEEKVKALNLQLLQNIDKLEAANKDLDRFAFMASHDLQEPLRKIRTFSERVSSGFSGVLGEEGSKFINRISSAAERMQLLINDILTFSKVASESHPFVKSDLNLLVREVIAEVEDQINQKKGKVLVDELPSLYVNPGLIRPLFNNLLNNALKYSRKDVDPVIRIYSESDMNGDAVGIGKAKNKYCRIFVQDNGIGFDQSYSEQIFGMFTRLHPNNEYEGTGIGLALCKKILEQHNGFISARSKVNEGSTFILSFPVITANNKIAQEQ